MRSTNIKKCLWTCLHNMVILRSQNKITDFLWFLAWDCPFKHITYYMAHIIWRIVYLNTLIYSYQIVFVTFCSIVDTLTELQLSEQKSVQWTLWHCTTMVQCWTSICYRRSVPIILVQIRKVSRCDQSLTVTYRMNNELHLKFNFQSLEVVT